jgi:hypothetical protein
MTPDTDPLERELRAFRPRPPSPDLRNRVARRLSAAPLWWSRAALAGGLVAAGLLAAAVLGRVPAPPSLGRPTPPAAEVAGTPPPTFAVYHRALAGSPEALDRLLTRHARDLGAPESAGRSSAHLFRDLLE